MAIATGLVLFDGGNESLLRFGEETLNEDGEGVGGAFFGGDGEVRRGGADTFGLKEEECGLYLPMGEPMGVRRYGRGVEGRPLQGGEQFAEGGMCRQLFDRDAYLARLYER